MTIEQESNNLEKPADLESLKKKVGEIKNKEPLNLIIEEAKKLNKEEVESLLNDVDNTMDPEVDPITYLSEQLAIILDQKQKDEKE